MSPVRTLGQPLLMREHLGSALRDQRLAQAKTLRDVSREAGVSLGYLSEVERGQKEASSELLAAICGALHVPLYAVIGDVSDRMRAGEAVTPLPVRLHTRTDPASAAA